jgi:hypothetical protein
MFLVPSSLGRSIVLSATLIGALATIVLPAAKLAAEILAARVAGMRKEAYPAVAAQYRAALQVSTTAQDGVQRELILTNKQMRPVVLVPILAKRKDFRDGYSKNDRLSVKMWIVLGISSSYSLDANASRGRARSFLWMSTKDCAVRSRNATTRQQLSNCIALPSC